MQFSVVFALALSAVGIMAVPIEQRNVECRGILNGDIRKSTCITKSQHTDQQYPVTATHLSRVMDPQPSLATVMETVTQVTF
jgi:hypothetical protein